MNACRWMLPALLLTVAAVCAAQAPDALLGAGDKAVPTFGSLDANVDGSLTPAEAERFPEVAAVFLAADANTDGRLNSDEYEDAVQNLIAG